jgi:alkaline phosphatase
MSLRKRLLLITGMLTVLIGWHGGGIVPAEVDGARAKYVFLFIGDGLGLAQRRAAELFLTSQKGLSRPQEARLLMNTFPAQGLATPQDLTSVIPDSASAVTAISCGRKTHSGVIGMDGEKSPCETIAESAKRKRWKVGILSSVTLDHATPAGFYAHAPSRRDAQDISLQLAKSGFDYFAGGQLSEPVESNDGSRPNALKLARKKGYVVATGREGLQALRPGAGKVIAVSREVDKHGAMVFALDRGDDRSHVSLAEYLEKGIELLDNSTGFFIMVEGGKIDWACHAHDAAASIHETLALDDAVAEAVRFYEKHPDETLIVVTADHETGGMAIGSAGTQYATFIENLRNQKMSYLEFERRLGEYLRARTAGEARFEDVMPLVHETFGLHPMPAETRAILEKSVAAGSGKDAGEDARRAARDAERQLKFSTALTDLEMALLREAWTRNLLSREERPRDDLSLRLYGGYEPLSVTLTTILSNKSGIGWTTFAHTGVPVPTSAVGVGADLFNGYYDQTEIHSKIIMITGLGGTSQ